MAISIHNVSDVNQLLGSRVKNKENSGSYKHHSHNNESNENETQKESRHGKFSQGLKIFLDTAMPEKKVLTELKGIADMDAVGRQLFIAMQRQFVHLRLSQMNERSRD